MKKDEILSEKNLARDSKVDSRIKLSHVFIIALALVSIVGFLGIVSETLFDYDAGFIVEGIWLITIGIGLIIEGKIARLKAIRNEGLTPKNFTNLTTVIIGILAIVAGTFSLPTMRIETHGFLAVKGIIAIIAIIVIVVQTWIIKH
jgi:hypothetical protein